MKSNVLIATGLALLSSMSFADGGDNARATRERHSATHMSSQMSSTPTMQEKALTDEQRAALDAYAGKAIQAYPEDYRGN
ncbi:hypothetical protein [Crenobacter cavernae]|uniref:DUF4148 domain-containing protein n=1 Tax=Crenobacter cavernae TaxID=2290923 RepID=A0A345Y4E3_9NEIS|nr:hypothetical protein [Crenobacter cavernae]AXK38795.1 hypothetical protein DWG20_04740 [Crenobacter cavernae]